MTLRNMPAMAETGMHMIVFNIITVFAFLIPIALVSAELATGWPQNGVYRWVEAAFGNKAGFLAVWLQWIQSIFGITSILAYVGGSLAYVFAPDLGNNRFFITATIISIYWLATWMNFKGTKQSGLISSVALVLGVLLPSILLILGSLVYVLMGNEIQFDTTLSTSNLVPSLDNTSNLLFFLSFVFGFVGIEVSASHAKEVENPQRNFPIALFSAAIIGFVITLLGGLSVAALIPVEQINPVNGATQAFSILLNDYHLTWLVPVMAFLIAMGAAGQVSTWIVGPIKGLWAAGVDGNLPRYFQKTNTKDVPVRLLIVQACFISVIGLSFLLVKNVNTMFLILTSIAIILYSMMYIMMFIAAIKLHYTQPNVPRAYKVPGGNLGMWLVCGTGGLSTVACLFIGFIPPTPNPMGTLNFELMIGSLCLISIAGAFIILNRRKKTWLAPQQSAATTTQNGE